MKRIALIDFEIENPDGSKQEIKAGETVGFTIAQFAGLVAAKRVHSDEEEDRRARADFEKAALEAGAVRGGYRPEAGEKPKAPTIGTGVKRDK